MIFIRYFHTFQSLKPFKAFCISASFLPSHTLLLHCTYLSLEKGMAIHSRALAWRIPWTEELGRLQTMGSKRVGHDWATNTHTQTSPKLNGRMVGCRHKNRIPTEPLDSGSSKKDYMWEGCAGGRSCGWGKVGSVCVKQAVCTAAAAKSLQSCPSLCDPVDCSPPGSAVPGILQTRTLEWVAISFSNAWKWKVKVKSLSCVRLCVTP